jgi:hypothetical protein
MPAPESPRPFLERHLRAILEGDAALYHATTAADLTLYEWYVTPHRIDGLPFHDFMLAEATRPDTPATALDPEGVGGGPGAKDRQRFDLANYHEQVYADTAICCYTLLISSGGSGGVTVRSHNESRVLVRRDGAWRVVHVHKSPAWKAPYES